MISLVILEEVLKCVEVYFISNLRFFFKSQGTFKTYNPVVQEMILHGSFPVSFSKIIYLHGCIKNSISKWTEIKMQDKQRKRE